MNAAANQRTPVSSPRAAAIFRGCGIALAAFMLTVYFPTLLIPWTPVGWFGLVPMAPGDVVQSVSSGSAAAAAGLLPGDRIVARTRNFNFLPLPGNTMTLTVERRGRSISTTLTALPSPAWSAGEIAVSIIADLIEFAGFILAFVLLLRRPGWVTALFLGSMCNAFMVYDANLWWSWHLPNAEFLIFRRIIYVLVFDVGFWFLALFALVFPSDRWTARRAIVGALFVPLAVVCVVFTEIAGGQSPQGLTLTMIPPVIAIGILLLTYARAVASERRRISWAVAGIAFSIIALSITDVLAYTGGYDAHQVGVRALCALSVAGPIAIAYAVIRHNVLDISFVVNRGLVAASLTAILLGLVGALRWLTTRYIEETHVAGLVDAVVTIGLGYGLNLFHKRAESTIERLIFRRRYIAEQHLRRAMTALPLASTRDAVSAMLVDDVRAELDLTSAAVFLHDGATYVRVASAEWPEQTARHLDENDALARLMRHERGTVTFREMPWRRSDLPANEARPAYAFALLSRGALFGIAVYGRHRDGSLVDPSEVALIESVVNAAASAYEGIAVEELRLLVEANGHGYSIGLPMRPEPSAL